MTPGMEIAAGVAAGVALILGTGLVCYWIGRQMPSRRPPLARYDEGESYSEAPLGWSDILRQLEDVRGCSCEGGSEHLPGNRSERGGAGDVPTARERGN